VLLWSMLDELASREAIESGACYADYTTAFSNRMRRHAGS
jgi:hypothetical protein